MNTLKSTLKARDLIRRGMGLHDDSGLTNEDKRLQHRRRIETLIYIGWGLIVIKAFVVVWAVDRFAMPFNPLWVIAPTLTFAFLATAAYYLGRD